MNLTTTTALTALLLCALLIASCNNPGSNSTSRHGAVGTTYTIREQFFDSTGKSVSDTTFVKTVTQMGINLFGRPDVSLLASTHDSTYVSYESGENISIFTGTRSKGEAWFTNRKADSVWLRLFFANKVNDTIPTYETTTTIVKDSQSRQVGIRAVTPTLTYLGIESIRVDTRSLVTEKIRGDVRLVRLDSGAVPPESQFSVTFWYAPQIGAIVRQEGTSTDANVQRPYLSAMTRYLVK